MSATTTTTETTAHAPSPAHSSISQDIAARQRRAHGRRLDEDDEQHDLPPHDPQTPRSPRQATPPPSRGRRSPSGSPHRSPSPSPRHPPPPRPPHGSPPGSPRRPAHRSPHHSPRNRNGELKINQPHPFNGNRTYARKFLLDVEAYLNLNSHVYDTDYKKKIFTLSFCQSGSAAAYAENKLIIDDRLETWNEFKADFNRNFLSSDIEGQAYLDLDRLQQTGTADEYVQNFRILAQRANLTQYEPLKRSFLKGLNIALRSKIAAVYPPPTTIQRYYQLAQALDNQYQQSLSYNPRQTTSSYPRSSGQNKRRPSRFKSRHIRSNTLDDDSQDDQQDETPSSAINDDFLELQINNIYLHRLSASDRERYMRENRCFRCGLPGHMASTLR